MDQSLKARLIGATVLVILAVLLIPELLTGRKAGIEPAQETASNDRRTFTIDIGKSGGTMSAPAAPGSTPAPTTVETRVEAATAADSGGVAAEEGRGDAPAPGRGTGVVQPGETRGPPPNSAAGAGQGAGSGPTATAPADRPETARALPTTGTEGSGSYFVQVGAFSSAESARKLVAQLEADGYSARIAPVSRGGKTLHRVRVGPAANRAAALQLAERLKGRGLPASLVKSD